MKGKVLGIPLGLIVLVLLIAGFVVVPLTVQNIGISKRLRAIELMLVNPTPVPTPVKPTLTPTPFPTVTEEVKPTVKPKKPTATPILPLEESL